MPRLTNSESVALLLHSALDCLAEREEFRNAVIHGYEKGVADGLMNGWDANGRGVKRGRFILTFTRLSPMLKARGEMEWRKAKAGFAKSVENIDIANLIAFWGGGIPEHEVMEEVGDAVEAGRTNEDELLSAGDLMMLLKKTKDGIVAMVKLGMCPPETILFTMS